MIDVDWLQCLIYISELMEHCEVNKFFSAVSESRATLESILHCCVLDEQVIKGLEGLSQYGVNSYWKLYQLFVP